MERTIGTFRYNVFIFGGMLFMIIAAFVSYGVIYFMAGGDETVIQLTSTYYAGCFSTYYVQQAVFLSFALCYPDLQLLLMMIIPIKVKYLGIFYTVLLAYEAIVTGLVNGAFPVFFAILFQFINLGLFYLGTGKLDHLRPKEVNRRHEFQRGVKMTPKGVTRHKCAVCGRSEVDDPNLEFRFCSKCNGNYEYCQDHLFTHQHVK